MVGSGGGATEDGTRIGMKYSLLLYCTYILKYFLSLFMPQIYAEP